MLLLVVLLNGAQMLVISIVLLLGLGLVLVLGLGLWFGFDIVRVMFK